MALLALSQMHYDHIVGVCISKCALIPNCCLFVSLFLEISSTLRLFSLDARRNHDRIEGAQRWLARLLGSGNSGQRRRPPRLKTRETRRSRNLTARNSQAHLWNRYVNSFWLFYRSCVLRAADNLIIFFFSKKVDSRMCNIEYKTSRTATSLALALCL